MLNYQEYGEPTSLIYLTQKVLSHDNCVSQTKSDANYIDDKICTIKPTDPASGACDRDEGGPVVLQRKGNQVETVIGVITKGSCENITPDISTRVDKYADWIASVVSDDIKRNQV